MALFTAETAVIAAKLSHAPTSARHQPKDEIKPAPPIPQPAPMPADNFRDKTLLRVRAQIESLLDDLSIERDAQKKDRLASALGRLNEIERQLAGRPMPGSLKPSSKQSRSSPQVEPTPITPQPVASDDPPATTPE